MRRTLSEAQGISPLIATLILIAAAVAGGAVVFSVMRGQASSLSGGGNFEIQYVELVSNNVTITIKNTGAVGISEGSVTVDGKETTATIGPVSPGKTYGTSGITAANPVAGKSYVVEVSVTFVDGGFASKAITVLATGSASTASGTLIRYATHVGSEGWSNEEYATGAPDGQGAESPIADSLSIWGFGFGTGAGTITKVVIKVVYRVDTPAEDDEIYLEYTLNPEESAGATYLVWVPTDTSWTEKSIDITDDDSVNGGSWDWVDIAHLYIRVTNSSVGDPDNSVVFVDAICVEITVE
jgi:hypothetical protein